jgi:hypothetical protein
MDKRPRTKYYIVLPDGKIEAWSDKRLVKKFLKQLAKTKSIDDILIIKGFEVKIAEEKVYTI